MKENNQKLVIKCLLFNLQHLNSTENEEKIISSNFFYYINDEQIFEIPIQILYRILNGYDFEINKLNQEEEGKIIEFLFKCLDVKGKIASILFKNLDIKNQRIELLYKLLENKDRFDFNMINPELLIKSLNELISEQSFIRFYYETLQNKIKELEQKNKEEITKLEQKISEIELEAKKQQQKKRRK